MTIEPQAIAPARHGGWLRNYSKDWLSQDLMAGLTSAAVVIPKAMAYATVAGRPLQVGLYTAFVPMAIYALLGTSRPLSVSSTTTLAILSAAALGQVAPEGGGVSLITAGATLAMLVGAMLVVASLLRLGFVANFISGPVLVGFKAGIGLVTVVDQFPKLLGLHIPCSSPMRSASARSDADRRRTEAAGTRALVLESGHRGAEVRIQCRPFNQRAIVMNDLVRALPMSTLESEKDRS